MCLIETRLILFDKVIFKLVKLILKIFIRVSMVWLYTKQYWINCLIVYLKNCNIMTVLVMRYGKISYKLVLGVDGFIFFIEYSPFCLLEDRKYNGLHCGNAGRSENVNTDVVHFWIFCNDQGMETFLTNCFIYQFKSSIIYIVKYYFHLLRHCIQTLQFILQKINLN